MKIDKQKEAKQRAQQEVFAGLYEKYNLEEVDFFEHKHYKLITREGIEKIIDAEGIRYKLTPWHCDEVSCTVYGEFEMEVPSEEGGTTIRRIPTTGSANRGSVRGDNSYFAEMAEKRCLSRGVLKLIQAYKYGLMGEDEIDNDEIQNAKQQRRQTTSSSRAAMFKG